MAQPQLDLRMLVGTGVMQDQIEFAASIGAGQKSQQAEGSLL